ncbi:MAG: hypothetical protein F4X56_00195 [Gammaproteobacteria bacterium]|nr:hypothetical protein [Gammaproteobacteria bacterium]
MYITTFYSFKGGVGRSMALVNAGIELARRNRRILFVDFDLEAPGLDTFKALSPNESSLGIVDFVHSYLSRGTTDDVVKYVSKCHFESNGKGEIWLMPAGGKKTDYASMFQNIDWGDLYANQDGYLLIEDLKQQWLNEIKPDYVLIDSRTGHTDVGGICTRQLPDAVAIFYFPNKQNLRGVSKVVSEIRSERDGPRKKDIQLHFIMSNVPDLDDEHQILEKEIEAFKTELDLNEDPMMVHRYDSLSLLNQEIFTQSRPKSRLAREYREIVDQIIFENLGDREGASKFLAEIESRMKREPWYGESALHEVRKNFEDIEKKHSNDTEILYQLGLLYHREQELRRAISLYQRSIDLGYDDAEIYLDRARALADLGEKDEASRDAFRALNCHGLSPRFISRALKLVVRDEFLDVANSNAVSSLNVEQRVRLISLIYFENEALRNLALQLLHPIVDIKPPKISDDWLFNELGLIYISSGKFKLAREWFYSVIEKGEYDIRTAFNFAVAHWGEMGECSESAFKKVIDLHESEPEDEDFIEDANYLQCIALAYWASGDPTKGLEFAEHTEFAIEKYERTFSCWRYLYVSDREFLKDISEMKKFMNGDVSTTPPVFINESEMALDI